MKLNTKNPAPLLNTLYFLSLLTHAAYAQISILGNLTQIREVRPGDEYSGAVLVENISDEPEDIRAYIRDYLYYSDGTNYYDEPGTHSRSNATWIIHSPGQTTIQPKERIAIQYQIRVPDDTSLIGSYWCMLMVEGVPEVPTAQPEHNLSIRVITRYGNQIITNISNTGTRQIQFQDSQLILEEGERFLQVKIQNIGELSVNPDLWIELFNFDGESKGTYHAIKTRILPGCSIESKIDLSLLELGSYKALLVADCGDEDLFGVNYTLDITE